MRGSTSIATAGSPRRIPDRSSRPTPRRRWWRSSRRRCRAIQAAIDNARTMLSYTRIVAPIDGRIGLRLVDEGNYVQAGDATGIVMITQMQADLGAVQPAAAAVPAGEQGVRERHARRSTRWRPTARPFGRSRQAAGDRQPDGSDHRHDPHEGRVSQPRAAALAGTVRQYPRAGRDAEAGRDGADRGGAARAERHLRLRGRRREQGRGAADHDRAAGRCARGDLGRREGAGAGGHHRLHAPVQRNARARAGGRRRGAAGCGAERRAADLGRRADPSAGASARAARGAENTDGKQWRQRSETTPATPSAKQ